MCAVTKVADASARWGLVGKRRGFDRNRILEGVGDWEIFVFNLPQGRGFGWGFVVSQLL